MSTCCDPDLIRVILMMARDNAGLREGEFGTDDLPRVRCHFAELIAGGYARGVVLRSDDEVEYAELLALTAAGDAFAFDVWPERTWHRVRAVLVEERAVPLETLRRGVAAAARAAQ